MGGSENKPCRQNVFDWRYECIQHLVRPFDNNGSESSEYTKVHRHIKK